MTHLIPVFFQELIFDHAFTQLGITANKINHPVLLTETVCNPYTARRRKNPSLFPRNDLLFLMLPLGLQR